MKIVIAPDSYKGSVLMIENGVSQTVHIKSKEIISIQMNIEN